MDMLNVKQLRVSEGNRKFTDPEKQKELVASVREKGIITPLLVRRTGHTKPDNVNPVKDVYEIVAGARRYRAAVELKLKEVPCTIREMSDQEAAEIRVVENLQRENINAMDEARELQRLCDFGNKPDQVADKVGKPLQYVKARLQLLALPEKVQNSIQAGALSANHGLVLARVPDKKKQEKLLETIQERKLSANAAENMLAHSGKDINDAPFDTAACRRCPNLGKNQAGLFDKDTDIDSICLDGACWARKCRECGRKAAGIRKKVGKKVTYAEALLEAVIEKVEKMPLASLEMLARTAGVDCDKVRESLEPAKPAAEPRKPGRRGRPSKTAGDKLAEAGREALAKKPRRVLVTKATVKGKDGAALSEEQKKAAEGLAATFGGKK